MRNLRIKRFAMKLAGFVLIENLIAIVLFAIGAVGIAISTAAAVKLNTDNQARAMAVAAATQILEPVTAAAWADGTTNDQLIAEIRKYVADGITIYGNVAAGASESFTVSVVEAVDAAGTDVLTSAGPYVSPITIAVLVQYQGNSDRINAAGDVEIFKIKRARASFTYVLPE